MAVEEDLWRHEQLAFRFLAKQIFQDIDDIPYPKSKSVEGVGVEIAERMAGNDQTFVAINRRVRPHLRLPEGRAAG